MSAVWVSFSVVPGDSKMLFAVLTSRQKAALSPLGSEVPGVVAEVLGVVAEVLGVVEAASSLLEVEQPETKSRLAQTARKSLAGT